MRSYYCFVIFLLNNLQAMENSCGEYVIREIIHRVLHFMEDCGAGDSRMALICFEILDSLCANMPIYHFVLMEVSKNLYFIVNKLQSFASNNSSSVKGEKSLTLLRFLLIDSTINEDLLEFMTAVSMLDEFPNQPQFVAINKKLAAIKSYLTPPGVKHVSNKVL